jgi:hypothetical protein
MLLFISSASLAVEPPSHASQESLPSETLPSFLPFKTKWMVQVVGELPFYSFYLGAPAIKGVAYLPNFAPRLGPRIIYKDIGATITLSLPIPQVERVRRGDSEQRNLVLNSYWHQYAYDIYFQRYKGFYVSSPFTELSASKPNRYPQIPDAEVLNYGMNWYYVFDPSQYSLKAAFDLGELQLQSGGSWLAQPFYNHLEMYLGSGFISGTDPNAIPTLPNLASGRFDTLGVTGGYGYTRIRGRFFATGQGLFGPAFQSQRIQRSDGDYSEVFSWALKLNVNASCGWNHDDNVFGFKFLLDTIWARVLNTQVSSSLVSAQVFVGRRF